MDIWIINHYAVPIKYYPLGRHTYFAKNLIAKGHTVKIFAASTVHNSDIQLISDDRDFREEVVDGITYVFVKCHPYQGNGIKRILNIWEFAWKVPGICRKYGKPDVILSCSMTLAACARGIALAKRLGVIGIADITDIWPETIVAYGAAGKCHPLVLALRRVEKWIYKSADALIFSLAGAYENIREQKWTDEIPQNKVFHINNGIDLKVFDANKEQYQIKDDDLSNDDIFKVVYTGSIRRVNNLGMLLDAAKLVKNKRVRFLLWGSGDEVDLLKKRVCEERITNVIFKGRVSKEYVPYIVCHADVNFAHCTASPIFRFGISMNKLFDYFAAGKPVLTDFCSKYDPVVIGGAGLASAEYSPQAIANTIDEACSLKQKEVEAFSKNARLLAEEHDFERLTDKLLHIIDRVKEGKF